MKLLKLYEEFLNEKRPEFHDSKAPDAHGRFKDLSVKDLAKWLIDTRNGDVKKISSSLTQQVVFNRNDDPEYAEKMEKTRQEVYKQLGREDLMEADAKPGPDKYMTGLDKEDEEDKEEQIKKQREMDDDDSDAYKEMPGDKEAREKGQVKTSKHVKKYHELYGEETDEALSDYEDKDADYDKLYKKYKYKPRNKRKKKSLVKEESEDGYRLRILADVGGDQATDWLADNPINFDKLKFALRNKAFTKYDLRDVIQGKAAKSIEKKVMKEISESQVNEDIFRTYNEVVGYEFNNFKEAYLELHKDNEVIYDKKDDVSYGIRKGEKEPHWKYFHDDYTLHHSEKDRDVLGLIHGKKMVSKGHPWSK